MAFREELLETVSHKNVYSKMQLQEGVTLIYDGINSSIYVLEGEGAAFVVDTGELNSNLVDYIRKEVTDAPLTLVLTHGHGDHALHANEFPEFCMSSEDDYLVRNLGIAIGNRRNIKDGDVISIPGLELTVVDCHGHTPGSMAFVDHKHKAVFHGDAFCNGRNLWMQIPRCSGLREFRETVLRVMYELKFMGVDESYAFYGGHIDQRYGCRFDPGRDNAPGFPLMEDLAELCRLLVTGELKGKPEKQDPSMGGRRAYAAHFGGAEMLYTLKQLS